MILMENLRLWLKLYMTEHMTMDIHQQYQTMDLKSGLKHQLKDWLLEL